MTVSEQAEDRLALAMAIRRAGGTIKEVSAALGVGRERARQLLLKAGQNQALPTWTNGLDIRLAKILLAAGYGSRHEVRADVERGAPMPRIGPARLDALRQWLEAGEQRPEHEDEDGRHETQQAHESLQEDVLHQASMRHSALSEQIIEQPGYLLDAVIGKLRIKNDTALAHALGVAPSVISRIRSRTLPVGAVILVRMLEVTELHLRELYQLVECRVPRLPGTATSARGRQ